MDKDQIQKMITSLYLARKPSSVLMYASVLFSASISLFFAIQVNKGSFFYSSVMFFIMFLVTSIFLIGMYVLLNDTKKKMELTLIKLTIDSIAINDWNIKFCIKNLHHSIVLHPAFRAIIGLYVCRFGKIEEGMSIIERSSKEVPLIKMAIQNGQIADVAKLKQLAEIIEKDVIASNFALRVYKKFETVSLALTLLILFALLTAFLLYLFAK